MKAKTALVFVILILLILVPLAPSTDAQHIHSQSEVIKGSEHPELIQESTAYRLFFLNLTQSPGSGRSVAEIQHERLKPVGLLEQEISATFFALQDFRSKYDQLAAEYNASDQSNAQWDTFVESRNALLDLARQQMKTYLSPLSLQLLHNHVMAEKSNMWIQDSASITALSVQGHVRMIPASFGRPQSNCSLHPGYSVYLSYSMQGGPPGGAFTATKSATLEGTTTVTGSCYAFHTPHLNMLFGSHNATYQTGAVPMTSYINLPGSITLSVMPGDQLGDNTDATIYCTVLKGNIFSNNIRRYLEGALSWFLATGPGTPDGTSDGNPVYIYNVKPWCSNGTPDLNPPEIQVNEKNAATDTYFPVDGVLWRLSSTSMWSILWPTGKVALYGYAAPPNPTTPTDVCTHTGPQK